MQEGVGGGRVSSLCFPFFRRPLFFNIGEKRETFFDPLFLLLQRRGGGGSFTNKVCSSQDLLLLLRLFSFFKCLTVRPSFPRFPSPPVLTLLPPPLSSLDRPTSSDDDFPPYEVPSSTRCPRSSRQYYTERTYFLFLGSCYFPPPRVYEGALTKSWFVLNNNTLRCLSFPPSLSVSTYKRR